jgi:hypothetical protein
MSRLAMSARSHDLGFGNCLPNAPFHVDITKQIEVHYNFGTYNPHSPSRRVTIQHESLPWVVYCFLRSSATAI